MGWYRDDDYAGLRLGRSVFRFALLCAAIGAFVVYAT